MICFDVVWILGCSSFMTTKESHPGLPILQPAQD